MSVKGKIKRLNREVEYLNKHIDRLNFDYLHTIDMLENLIKFFVMNQVGRPADGGVQIGDQYIDKVRPLEIKIWYESYNKAFIIKLEEGEKDGTR